MSSIESAPASIPATSAETFAARVRALVGRDAQPVLREVREPRLLRESRFASSKTADTAAGACLNCIYEMPLISVN